MKIQHCYKRVDQLQNICGGVFKRRPGNANICMVRLIATDERDLKILALISANLRIPIEREINSKSEVLGYYLELIPADTPNLRVES